MLVMDSVKVGELFRIYRATGKARRDVNSFFLDALKGQGTPRELLSTPGLFDHC
jgi:hypothetical protein